MLRKLSPYQRLSSTLFWVLFVQLSPVWSQGYILNGTAINSGTDCYQLTTTQGNQNGAVWYEDLIDLSQPFDLNFTMNFGNLDASGADGMVFVLQDVGTGALGATGGGLGFNGFDPSFGIEFDTWLNGQYGDISNDHIGFISDGSVDHGPPTGLGGPVNAHATGANIEDGEDHPVQITWDPATQIMAVYFDCELRLAEQIDLIDGIFSGQPQVYWGFTGSTGGSYNNQSVCLSPNILATGPATQVCPGGTVELNVVGAPGSDYVWSPGTFLSDTLGASVMCTPEETTTYYVTYDGFCENQITDSITVFVEDLQATTFAEPGTELTCEIEEIFLSGSSNFASGVEYNWELGAGNGQLVQNAGAYASTSTAGEYLFIANALDGNCADTVTVEVIANFDVIETFLDSSPESLNCYHDSVVLTAELNGDGEIQWTLPSGSEWYWLDEPTVLVAESPGTWGVNVTNPDNGCTFTTEITVPSDFTQPQVDAGYADTLTCSVPTSIVQGVMIEPEDYTAILNWTWTDGALNPYAPWSPWSPQVLSPGTYFLEVMFEENGCVGSDSLVVIQDPEASVDATSARMPNVISPNKDGQNERLVLHLGDDPDFPLLSIVERLEIVIFNRWGNQIFESVGAPVEWDGRVNGEPVSEGTYYYRVQYLIVCGEEQQGTLFGSFQVFR